MKYCTFSISICSTHWHRLQGIIFVIFMRFDTSRICLEETGDKKANWDKPPQSYLSFNYLY